MYLYFRSEVWYMWVYRAWSGLLVEMFQFNGQLLTAVIVVTYYVTQGHLEARHVFPMIAVFNILCNTLLDNIPWGIKNYLEICVSCSRLEVGQ